MAVALQPGHNRRTLRDSVRRLFAQSSRSGNPGSSGMFERAQHTNIHNATFNINHYGGGTSPAPSRDFPSDNHGNAVVQQENMAGTSSVPGIQPSPHRGSPDVYVDLLLTKGHGYPLWIPSSNRSLPIFNRTLGISIGDVGVLTPEGGFDFLFNVFHDSEHPINSAVGTPSGFMPFPQPANSSSIQQFIEWNAGYFLSDPSVTRIDDGRDILTTVLKTTAPESAILMMPKDVHTTKLKSLSRLRRYFANNLEAWYIYVKHTLGHDIENGDLRLVYGYRKSSGFGIATAFNLGHARDTQLTFSTDESWARTSGCSYRWSYIGSAEVKAGPSVLDHIDLPAQNSPQNLCLFVNTIDIQVSSGTWQHIEDLETVPATDWHTAPTFNSTVPQYGAERHFEGDPDTQEEQNNSHSDYKPQERTFHPSTILHGVLRQIVLGAEYYTVCDDDWSDLLTENVVNARHFLDRVFENSLIVNDEDQGLVYFSKKDKTSDLEIGKPTFNFRRMRTAAGLEDTFQWQCIHTPRQDEDSTMLINLECDPPEYSPIQPQSPSPQTIDRGSLKRKFSGDNYGNKITKSTESFGGPLSSTYGSPKRSSQPIDEQSTSSISVLPVSQDDIYTIIDQIGEGIFGKVYSARNTYTGTLVVLKRVHTESAQDGFPASVMREIKILQSLRHDNIIRLYEVIVSNGDPHLVFEHIDHNLTAVLTHDQPQFTFLPEHLKSLSHQLLSGLSHIHKKGIIHRNLNCSNLLISNRGEVKLSDFSCSRFYDKRRREEYTNRVITLWYRPPELLFGATVYGAEVDMWSAGCIIVELFTRRPLFQGADDICQIEAIYKILGTLSISQWPEATSLPWFELVNSQQETSNCFREILAGSMTPSALDLAEKLLMYNPAQRIDAIRAMASPYFLEQPHATAPVMHVEFEGEWKNFNLTRERARIRMERPGHPIQKFHLIR